MVGVAEMLTFAFGFWVGTGVGVTLDFFITEECRQEFCNSHQKKFDGIKILQTDTIKSQSEAAGDSGVVSYQT